MDALSNFSLTGENTLSQILFALVLVILVYVSLSGAEYVYTSITRMYKDRIELFPDTIVSGPRMYTVVQNPLIAGSNTINFSDNQRSGVEFSYALFINVSSATFNENTTGAQNLYHILHKGYSQLYPLFCPGIFLWGNTNTLRIFLNNFDTWNNHIDIQNIPMDKWFHLVISCKGNTQYIYINGNLKAKTPMTNNSPPYQNFGNVYAFSGRKINISLKDSSSAPITGSLATDPLFQGPNALSSYNFAGPITGMISRVYYFAYALTYTEIQSLMNMGPSSKMIGPDMTMTQSLSDTWWTNKLGP
jgi:hypothetical protein